MTFNRAAQICVENNATLARISTVEEYELVRNLTTEREQQSSLWVGKCTSLVHRVVRMTSL